MKVCEFDVYKSIYCGLCKQLGDTYGYFAHFTLSYDFTFLAAVSMGLKDDKVTYKKRICPVNPLTRKTCACAVADLSFTGATAMIMGYYKIIDELKDSRFIDKIKAAFIYPFVALFRRKAKKIYPEIEQIVGVAMSQQFEIEKSKPNVDQAADPSANAMGHICELLGKNETETRVLYRFGYLIGRWVYLMDALDDLEKDIKEKNFNAFLVHESLPLSDKQMQQIKMQATQTINLTIAQIISTYELLHFEQYKSIIDNIIYLGLRFTLTHILNKTKEGNKEHV